VLLKVKHQDPFQLKTGFFLLFYLNYLKTNKFYKNEHILNNEDWIRDTICKKKKENSDLYTGGDFSYTYC